MTVKNFFVWLLLIKSYLLNQQPQKHIEKVADEIADIYSKCGL